MSKSSSDHDHAIGLLKLALAALGEDLVDRAASALPNSRSARARAMTALDDLSADASAIARALSVLERRRTLLG